MSSENMEQLIVFSAQHGLI